jgi:hypothetical protein
MTENVQHTHLWDDGRCVADGASSECADPDNFDTLDADGHADDDPVIFKWAANSNISFRGEVDSGYTWGGWREMSDEEKGEAYIKFIFDNLGVEVWDKE